MSKVTDASLAKAIKMALTRPPAGHVASTAQDFAGMRLHAGNSVLADAISELGKLTDPLQQAGAEPQIWIRLSATLRDQQMPTSARLLWKGCIPLLKTFPPQDWVPAAPGPEAVEATRKTTGIPVPEFTAQLLTLGTRLYGTAGAEWLMQRGSPEQISPLLELALDGMPRPRGLDEPPQMLRLYLNKDLKGRRLALLLDRAVTSEVRLTLLTGAAGEQITLRLAEWLKQCASPAAATKLIQFMFVGALDDTKGARKAAASIATLASSILKLDPLSEAASASLGSLAKLSKDIRLYVQTTDKATDVWTFEPITNRSEGRSMITFEGAKHWALIYSRAVMDKKELGYLESFAANVGIKEFAVPKQQTAFDPKLHADTEGGLMTGDPVTVLTPGWMFEGIAVVKAQTRHDVNRP